MTRLERILGKNSDAQRNLGEAICKSIACRDCPYYNQGSCKDGNNYWELWEWANEKEDI